MRRIRQRSKRGTTIGDACHHSYMKATAIEHLRSSPPGHICRRRWPCSPKIGATANDCFERHPGTHQGVEVSPIADRGEAITKVPCRHVSFDAAEAKPAKARRAGQRIQAMHDG